MKKLVMTRGLPASGKSTWAKEFIKDKKDWVRLNNDDLTAMLYGVEFKQGGVDLLDKTRKHILEFLMAQNLNIIIDNTNLHLKQEIYYREVVGLYNAEHYGEEHYEFSIKDFTNVPIGECLVRNRARSHPVPDRVIYDMHKAYLAVEAPALAQNSSAPKAIVVDIDGTMALVTNRTPYEMSKVYSDEPNTPIVNLVKTMANAGHTIFFISGRDECSRAETVRWLADKAGFPAGSYQLFLRPDEDQRPDTQYKKDVFAKYLKDKFYVDFWIEDRWRMTNAVRNELGITCLQCADGHF
jgi:predicted kinase